MLDQSGAVLDPIQLYSKPSIWAWANDVILWCLYIQPSLCCFPFRCCWLAELRLTSRLSLERLYHEPPRTDCHQTQEVDERIWTEEPSDQEENICISPPVSSSPGEICAYFSEASEKFSMPLRGILSEAESICWLIRAQSLGVFSSRWSYLYSSFLL